MLAPTGKGGVNEAAEVEKPPPAGVGVKAGAATFGGAWTAEPGTKFDAPPDMATTAGKRAKGAVVLASLARSFPGSLARHWRKRAVHWLSSVVSTIRAFHS